MIKVKVVSQAVRLVSKPKIIRVKPGCYVISRDIDNVIYTPLGTCTGVATYHPIKKIGAIHHVFMPTFTSNSVRLKATAFADTGVPIFINELKKIKCVDDHLEIYVVHGGMTGYTNIGNKNFFETVRALHQLNIAIKQRLWGGKNGSSISLNIATGRFSFVNN